MGSSVDTNCLRRGKVLVLGASGQLGRLLQAVWPVANDVIWHGRKIGCSVQFDLMHDSDAYVRTAKGARAALCLAGVTAANTTDDLSLNSTLALAAIKGAAIAGIPHVFLASSAAVYGRSETPLSEAGPAVPISEYGQSKLKMEQSAIEMAQRLGQPMTILRIGNVAGADAILGGWRQGMRIDQFDDGRTPRRSYIGPVTLAQTAHKLTRATALPSILNVAAPGALEMGQLLEAAGLKWTAQPATEATIRSVELDTWRLAQITPFTPKSCSVEGIVAECRNAGCL